MKITKLIAATGVTFTLVTGPAFAQSSATKADDYAKEKVTTETKEMATEKAGDMVKSEDTNEIAGSPLTIETPTKVMTTTDAEITTEGDVTMIEAEDITTMEKAPETQLMESDISAPAPLSDITCPTGTTAQADGTCMVTGNSPE